MKKRTVLSLSAALPATIIGLAMAGDARADTIGITSAGGTSTESLGSFTGIVEFNANGFANGADLSFKLTNTSPANNGGYITGFVFNVAKPGLTVMFADVDGKGNGFDDVTGKGLKATPFGTFEEGAAIGGALLGGGSPTSGIQVGQTREFLFHVGGDLSGVSALTFVSEESVPTGGNDGEIFVARFKGFFNDGSDKVVPGEVLPPPPPPPPPQVVPVPAAVWGGASLLGALGVGRSVRRRRRLEE